MKSSIEDIGIVILSIGVALFLGFILYRDLNNQFSKSSEDRGTPIAILTFKENKVLHKFGDSVVWVNARSGIPVYNYDSIKTSENANAVLIIGTKKEGNLREIKIGNNTMITIITDGENGMQLAVGSFGVNGEKIEGEQSIITLNTGVVSIETNPSGELSVEVEKGIAQIEVNGKVREITDNKKAVVNNKTGLAIEEVLITTQLPRDSAMIITKEDLTEVLFSWLVSKELEEAVLLEVALDSAFSKIVISENILTSQYTTKLSPGSYYWRLTLDGNKTRGRRLSVIMGEPPYPTYPDGDVVTYNGTIPEIPFKWRGAERADYYLVEIFDSKDQKNLVHSFQSEIGFKKWRPVREGEYFWKVTPYYDAGGYAEASLLANFKVISRENILSPGLIKPRAGYVFQPEKEDVNVQFSWKGKKQEELYRFILYRISENKENIIDEFTTSEKKTSHTFKEEGVFLWKVHTIDNENNISKDAVARSFKVKFPKERKETYSPIPLQYPTLGIALDFFELVNGKIIFRWTQPHRSIVHYEVKVGQTGAMDDEIVSFSVKNNYLKMSSLSPGKYFWQVIGFDSGGRIDSKSKIESFSVFSSDTFVGAPVIKSPYVGENVLIDKVGNLQFSWFPLGNGITYQITLVNKENGEIIFNKTDLSENSYTFTDMSKLNIGQFYYTLQAFKDLSELGLRKTGQMVRTDFSISLSLEPQASKIDELIIKDLETEGESP